jgi:hypothetical protein
VSLRNFGRRDTSMLAMKRVALVLPSILLALAAVSPAGAMAKPAHRDRCAPRAHEQVRARSNSAVVLLRRTRVLIGCSTATGRRRVMETTSGDSTYIDNVHVRGTAVAYVITEPSRYGDTVTELWREDAVRDGRGALVERTSWVGDVAIGPGATIAYTTGGGPSVVLRLNRPNGAMLHVDGALHLRDVRFTGDRLTWRHGKTTQSADIAPIDRCGGHSGTLTLALTSHTAPNSVTACLRATGAARTFITTESHSTAVSGPWIATHSAMTSGPWIATHPDNTTIITANLATNAGETIAAPGVGHFLAINANGTVAWTTPFTLLGTGPIFVHDATGTRVVDTIDGVMTFGFDGTTLRYGPKTLQLPR